jgi:hypothetical protein
MNRAIVSGSPRSVKNESEVWRNGIEEEITAGQTLEIWADFEDPVSTLTDPIGQTDYTAFAQTQGAGTDMTSDVSIVMTGFTKAAKLEITNNHISDTAYLNFLRLRGTPATVDYEIKEVFEDSTSIGHYNERQIELINQYIDNRKFARNMAKDLVRRYKNPNEVIRLKIRGVPQLQLRDQVRVKEPDLDVYKYYRILRIQGILERGSFTQNLTLREVTDSENY